MSEIQLLPEAKIRELIEGKAVMVTVNQRLSRYLARQYNRQQMDAGKTVWETPDILPYAAWLGRVYDQARYSMDNKWADQLKIRLSPAQAHFLWQQIIQDSEAGRGLLRVSETADMAARAWEICRQWQIPVYELSLMPPEETTAFLGWADAFERHCSDNAWLDAAGLGNAVATLFESKRIAAPDQLILAGFDELTPQQMALVKTLEDLGCQVFGLPVSDASSQLQRCELPDNEAEIAAAARWARDRLEKNPSERIGVIVSDLNALRPDLIRIFDDILHPSRILLPQSEKKRAYNISLGRPLSEYPLIRAAVMILNFACRELSTDEYSLILRSPFLSGAHAEISRRAMLDARIRENGETALSISGMIYFSKAHKDKDRHPGIFCPQLNKCLEHFKKAVKEIPGNQPPSAWVRDFLTLLDVMGWTKGRSLNSEEIQTVNAWHGVLQEFSALDRVCRGLDIHSAVGQFAQYLDATIFQPETEDVPIQIMGMLEVAGERFDSLWIMGLDAESWPPAPKPNPFLPNGVQKKYNVSHASPERELAYARLITQRLLAAAPYVMVSSPLKEKDTVLLPSPLIAHIALVETEPATGQWWTGMLAAADFEQMKDSDGPVADSESRISGGTGLLKAQAACPFSAFAAYRLQAKPLEVPESGLNARERGSLIHNALEFFWEKIKTLQALTDLSENDLSAAVAHVVDLAVSAMAKKYPRTFTSRFTALEKERLMALMLAFLAIDAQRTPFIVAGCEQKMVATIAGIELTTYADRIDKLDDGRLVIIDYKTGEPKVADWFTDRLAEPQLPLYSFAVEEDVAGVVFAQIKKGSVGYLGVATDEQIVPGAKGPGTKKSPMEHFSSMDDVIDLWKGKIEFLADEVRQGLAVVAPVSVNTSCRYCDLGPICRIGEIDFLSKN